MNISKSRFIKLIISIIAIANIIVMMVFQYGMQSSMPANTDGEQERQTNDTTVGTIESVEKETAAKEAEEIQTAFAREEKEEKEEKPEEDENERDPDAPILELTDDHIYLKVGDRFNYMSYIKTMVDVDGSDLSHYIYLDRDVDTSEPGEIELTYRITSVITGKSDSQVLLITIRE